ncbi:unnamed protein product [Danaus chrysippus]|uniref:(African queen) hypothetical protein n=1 Tax=Danaus chrysippus TaxID=151541 RepID=A0A8J2QQV6_9NEOP|nr:unnamed protein product [Danaus chrysippus]
MALRQGAPHIALESMSQQKPHYITIRNIKAVSLSELQRFDEAMTVLRSVLDVDQPEQKDKHTFFKETITKVRTAIEDSNNKDSLKRFEDIETALKDRNLIDDQTIDQLITSEITLKKKNKNLPRGMPKMAYNMRHKKDLLG